MPHHDTPRAGLLGQISRHRQTLLVAGLTFGVVLAVVLLFSLYFAISEALISLRQAQNDNSTWLVSQSEVELLKYRLALDAAIHAPEPADLTEVKKRFDVYFNRVEVIAQALNTSTVLRDSRAAETWSQLHTLTHRDAAIFDLGDDNLRKNLGVLAGHARRASDAARSFAVGSLQQITDAAMQDREKMGRLLTLFAVTGALLLLFLTLVSGLLLSSRRRLKTKSVTLRNLSATLARTLDAAPDAVLIVNSYGRITNCNRAAEILLGREREGLEGRMIDTWLLTETGEMFRPSVSVARVIADGSALSQSGERDRAIVRRDSSERVPVEVTVSAVADGEDRDIQVLFARDISARLQVEENLRSARDAALQGEDAKARFLAVMSHEMRTPLSGLIAALDILQNSTRQSRRQREFLAIARQCGETALEQIDDVLELTRLDAAWQSEREESYDLAAALREIVEQNRLVAKQRGNRLVLSLPEGGGIAVIGNRRLLSRAIYNLLGNAIKFTTNGRVELRLTVSQTPEGQTSALCEVVDTGIGIAAAKVGDIFRDFETIDKSYARRAEGTGLGLGIARRAIERMGGTIGVDSIEGMGSRFWFRIPLVLMPQPDAETAPAEAVVPIGPDTATPPDDPAACRVLIAEDNPVNRRVLREMLLHLGCQVEQASDGLEAVRMAERTRFDLILMDISMPNLDGIEAARQIRAGGMSQAARQVGLTAHAMPSEIAAIQGSGLTEVIVKPATIGALAKLLQTAAPLPTPAAAPAPAANLLDVECLNALAAILPGDRFAAALQAFQAETDDLLGQISGCPDSPETNLLAHKVAGSAAVFGAVALRLVMARFETDQRAADAPLPPERLTEILACWQQTRQALDAMQQKVEHG